MPSSRVEYEAWVRQSGGNWGWWAPWQKYLAEQRPDLPMWDPAAQARKVRTEMMEWGETKDYDAAGNEITNNLNPAWLAEVERLRAQGIDPGAGQKPGDQLAYEASLRAQGIDPAELPFGTTGQIATVRVLTRHGLPIPAYLKDYAPGGSLFRPGHGYGPAATPAAAAPGGPPSPPGTTSAVAPPAGTPVAGGVQPAPAEPGAPAAAAPGVSSGAAAPPAQQGDPFRSFATVGPGVQPAPGAPGGMGRAAAPTLGAQYKAPVDAGPPDPWFHPPGQSDAPASDTSSSSSSDTGQPPADFSNMLGITGMPADVISEVNRIFGQYSDVNVAISVALAYVRSTDWYRATFPGITDGIRNGLIRDERDYRAYVNALTLWYRQYLGRDVSGGEVANWLVRGETIENVGRRLAGQAWADANASDVNYYAGAFGPGELSGSELTAYGEQQAGLPSRMGGVLERAIQEAVKRYQSIFQGVAASPALSMSEGRVSAGRRGGDTGR